jgi:cholesterol transport system auxiliary component
MTIGHLAAAAVFITSLAACSAVKPAKTPGLYDFGPLPALTAPAGTLPPVSIADVRMPAWLDRPLMYYRLAYADTQQARPYADSRWTMSPGALFGQRLKAGIAQAGGIALSATDSAANVPVVRIDVDDFTQVFSSPSSSVARIALRASVFNGRTLVAQKTFIHEAPAESADAAGGAHAFATAGDTVIREIILWLSSLPIRPKAAG